MAGILDLFFGLLGNSLYAVGSYFKDMLWLRLFLILGALTEMLFGMYNEKGTILSIVIGAGIIAGINVFQLIVLIRERRESNFTEREQLIRKLVFPYMPKNLFKKIMELATWSELMPGVELIKENTRVNELMLIYKGSVDIIVNGKAVSAVRDGGFIGEISFLGKSEASATVVTSDETTLISWERDLLEKLITKNPEIENALYSIFSKDLIAKLTKLNQTKSQS